ncbi:MAG: glycosyltransferase [Acidobacteriota bacterium]|nr:glycosyltransferase [Acidobacteriota bacterium]
MITAFATVLVALAAIGTISSTVFLGLSLLGARKFRRDAPLLTGLLPPASLLKPLHGLEPQLEKNLESFFDQDYPAFEVIFAVDEVDDAALPVAERVCRKYPHIPSTILITGLPPWPNPPAYSFSRMAEKACYDVLVTSDSDVMVRRNYLREVVQPLLEKNTGMATCLYRGFNAGGFWSLMDAMGMSVEMTAGVLTANMMEGIKFGLGPTIVVRRDALDAIGGYAATGEYFSNDFIIGNLIAERGYEVVLSRHVIDHVVPPMTFKRMWRRQLRWATGTKYSRPKGHFGTGLIFAVPYGIFGLIGASLFNRPWLGLSLFGWAILNRLIECLAVGYGVTGDPNCLRKAWLYPVRDLLGFCVWTGSYLVSNSKWRRGNFELMPGGKIVMRDGLLRPNP